MVAKKIKELREKAGMTQKNLAEKLYVSPQAVSRWESGDTEPSTTTLNAIAEIFGVSLNELFGHEAPKPEVIVEKETVYTATAPVLGVCENCKKAITDSDDYIITRHSHGRSSSTTGCRCKACDERIKKKQHDNAVSYGVKCRIRSFVWSGIITAVVLAIALIVTISRQMETEVIIGSTIASILLFPFLSCLFLKNNFVGDMVLSIASWGFVKFPGLIFSLDLDGIIWLLTVKLAFWIIGIMLAVVAFSIAIALGLIVSVFVYPYAITKSFKHPEKSEDF